MPVRKACSQGCGGPFFLGPADLKTYTFPKATALPDSTHLNWVTPSFRLQCFPHSTHHLTTPTPNKPHDQR